ncbi:MAG: glycosyltransferase, partial [Verrucomicrobia bacterium]|nr:glycosyltransferase [Verrucomicrobiota bacterium]
FRWTAPHGKPWRPANPASLTAANLKPWKEIPKISWLGHRKDVPERMKAADCVVIPSYREGFPRVLLEAAAAVRPVIVSDIPGCRELVDPGKTGLIFSSRNISELAAAMEQIHLQPALRERLALGLFRKAKSKCSIAHVSKAYENLFQRALRAGHPRG